MLGSGACGFVGPLGAIVIGLVAGLLCLWGVNGLKRMLGADDSLDVFGVHGVGGIVGALLTGVFAAPSLGGTGIYDYVANAVSADYSIGGQVWIQLQAVLTTLVWSGVVSFIAYKVVDLLLGLRQAILLPVVNLPPHLAQPLDADLLVRTVRALAIAQPSGWTSTISSTINN